MTPVDDLPQFQQTLAEIRRGAEAYVTNFYVDPRRVESWIAQRRLGQTKTDRALIILRREPTFMQLYFAAAGLDAVSQAVREILPESPRPLVTDLIAPPANVTSLTDLFATQGFLLRERLRRMTRTLPLAFTSASETQLRVEPASAADADWIHRSLWSDFDPLVDQLPARDELLAMINDGAILVSRCGASPAGFLVQEAKGSASLVKYWYILPEFRGQGAGSALMRDMIERSPALKRISLWVKEGNTQAVNRYLHYGLQWERLVDHVYWLQERQR